MAIVFSDVLCVAVLCKDVDGFEAVLRICMASGLIAPGVTMQGSLVAESELQCEAPAGILQAALIGLLIFCCDVSLFLQ